MKYKTGKHISHIVIFLTVLICVISVWTLFAEKNVAVTPNYAEVSLEEISKKERLSTEDFRLIREQTGLSENATKALWREGNRKELLLREQQLFFHTPTYQCRSLTGLVKVEVINGKENYFGLYDLQPGDVLLTPNTHTFGYRHGHSALAIGNGALLEATEIGKPVSKTEAFFWGGYPAGIHLRITESAAAKIGMSRQELGSKAAAYAEKNLIDDNYRLTAGAFHNDTEENETQCAHLIWAAFAPFGIDVSARDFPVTPHALLQSGKFEVIRFWGFDPRDIDW